MMRAAVEWLTKMFVDERRVMGWRRDTIDDKLPDGDISMMVYAALGHVYVQEGIVNLSERLQETATTALSRLSSRSYFPSATETIGQANYVDSAGRRISVALPARTLWYPWSVGALVDWRRIAVRKNWQQETIRALDRSRGHVVIDLGGDMLSEMTDPRTLPFVWAETCFGLASLDAIPQ